MRHNDVMELSNYEMIFQTYDEGFRWGIMITNGSESLNNVFRLSRRLPMAVIVDDTLYKCNIWFVKRRNRAMNLANANQQWSSWVELKLRKQWEKAIRINLVLYMHGEVSTKFPPQISMFQLSTSAMEVWTLFIGSSSRL